MKKFKIVLERETTEQATIEIEANNLEQASELAHNMAKNDEIEFFSCDWIGDTNIYYKGEVV